MASSLKTMNQVRKPAGQAAPKPVKTQAVQPPVVEEAAPTQASTKKVAELKKELPETLETVAVSDVLPTTEAQAKKVNTAETPEDAIMQSEAVTPDLDSAVIPKKQVAKKAAPRTSRQAGKKK